MKYLFLDSQPAGLLSNPKIKPDVAAISYWLTLMTSAGHLVYLPEIIDYELRRELIRSGRWNSLSKLNNLATQVTYLPLNTDAMRLAADLWAWARNSGMPTGDPKKIDIDVILAAQALTLGATLSVPTTDLQIVTTIVSHLSRFLPADLWTNITP